PRPCETDAPGRDSISIHVLVGARGLAASGAIGWFSRAREPGTTDPRLGLGEIGGRMALAWLLGRYTLAGDATEDGTFNVDAREYPTRFLARGAWPEYGFAAQIVAGLDVRDYGGTDASIELRPL